MSANAVFRDEELVHRKVKVGNEWQVKTFPVVGGRLRLVHENNPSVSIETEIIRLEDDLVVVKATVETDKGKFTGTGTASAQRDARLADSLVELAETRAIARSLRFCGIGTEFCSAEEVNHVEEEPEKKRSPKKNPEPVFPDAASEGKTKAKTPQKPKTSGNGLATQAQVRALYALSKKVGLGNEERENLLSPLNAESWEHVSIADASNLIQYLQSQTAAA